MNKTEIARVGPLIPRLFAVDIASHRLLSLSCSLCLLFCTAVTEMGSIVMLNRLTF